MPAYWFDITVPKATTQASPIKTDLVLTKGTLVMVGLGFPEGSKALARIQIWHNEYILFPANPNNSFAWDDYFLTFPTQYVLDKEGVKLKAVCWNNDNVFDHILTLMLVVNELSNEQGLFTSLAKSLWG